MDEVKLINMKAGNWDRTIMGVGRVKETHPERLLPPDKNARYGYYLHPETGEKFPVIGRDWPVTNSVYIGGGEREVILVQDRGEALKKTQDELDRRIFGNTQKWAAMTLRRIFDLVKEKLRYDSGVKDLARTRADQLMPLNEFLEWGVGICRHQALLVAFLAEKLKASGDLPEVVKISVDRNQLAGSAHAWARITLKNGLVIIVDPAQDYFGSLEDADNQGWVYWRPEDYKKYGRESSDKVKHFYIESQNDLDDLFIIYRKIVKKLLMDKPELTGKEKQKFIIDSSKKLFGQDINQIVIDLSARDLMDAYIQDRKPSVMSEIRDRRQTGGKQTLVAAEMLINVYCLLRLKEKGIPAGKKTLG